LYHHTTSHTPDCQAEIHRRRDFGYQSWTSYPNLRSFPNFITLQHLAIRSSPGIFKVCLPRYHRIPRAPSHDQMKRSDSATPSPPPSPADPITPPSKKSKLTKKPTPKSGRSTKSTPAQANGTWDPQKRGAFVDEIIAAGYRSADLDAIAGKVSGECQSRQPQTVNAVSFFVRFWCRVAPCSLIGTLTPQLELSKRQLVDRLVPKKANLRAKAVKAVSGEQ
jgi:hypothetical protein